MDGVIGVPPITAEAERLRPERFGVSDALAEIAPQIIVASDPPITHEDLRRGRNIMAGLEGLNLLSRGKMMVLDRKARALQQVQGLEAVRAGVIRHHHPVKARRLNGGRNGSVQHLEVSLLFLSQSRSVRI